MYVSNKGHEYVIFKVFGLLFQKFSKTFGYIFQHIHLNILKNKNL